MSWVGVVDSGVGGLSVWKELRQAMPHESLLYYADTASCPYGGRGREQIIELSRRAVDVLLANGAKIVVVACNTMTAAAITILRAENPTIPFVGMEPAVKQGVRNSRSGVVGILATRATLRGELYLNTKSQYAASVEVIEVAGVGLVEMVEQNQVNSPQCEALLRKYIDPMVERGADTLVLGCTHYPFLTPAIERIYGKTLRLENPAPAVAKRTKNILQEKGLLASEKAVAQYKFLTSGSADDLVRLENSAHALM
ncbi:MAG: glutamate racemase [Mucinivorans sp.]